MTDRSDEAWREVDHRLSEFGRVVSERYRKAGEGRGDAEPEGTRRALEEAFSALTRHLDQAFTSVGETIRDQETRESLKKAGRSLVDAVSSTVGELGDEIRKHRPGSPAPDHEPPND